jgi:hypothetical protein
MSTATPPDHPTWAGVVKGKPPPSVPTGPSPPAPRLLQLYRDCVRGGHGPGCVLRLREERRNSASHAEWEKQPQEPQRSRDTQQMRGGRNGQGGNGGPGRKEEEGQPRKEQQLPQQQRQPPARQEKQSPAGAAAIGAAAVSRSSSR